MYLFARECYTVIKTRNGKSAYVNIGMLFAMYTTSVRNYTHLCNFDKSLRISGVVVVCTLL